MSICLLCACTVRIVRSIDKKPFGFWCALNFDERSSPFSARFQTLRCTRRCDCSSSSCMVSTPASNKTEENQVYRLCNRSCMQSVYYEQSMPQLSEFKCISVLVKFKFYLCSFNNSFHCCSFFSLEMNIIICSFVLLYSIKKQFASNVMQTNRAHIPIEWDWFFASQTFV